MDKDICNNIITLVILSKNLEELQQEVMKILSSNHDVLLGFLRSLSRSVEKRTENKNTISTSLSSLHRSEESQLEMEETRSEIVEIVQDKKPSENLSAVANGSLKDETLTDSRTQDLKKNRSPKKRRKSKYDYITGDLSHICREPKRCKYKHTSKKDKMKEDDNTFSDEKLEEEKIKGNNENTNVLRMIEILRFSKSRNERNDVISELQNDPKLRIEFLKEKARMGKMKIPILADSFPEESTASSCEETSLSCNTNDLRNEECSSVSRFPSETKSKKSHYLIKFIQSIVNSKLLDECGECIELHAEDLQLLSHAAALNEPRTRERSNENAVTESIPYQDQNHTYHSFTSAIQDTNFPFQNILIGGSSGETDGMSAQGQNGDVFGNVLHDHFQQLACDQYAENNPFVLENAGTLFKAAPESSTTE